MYSPESYGGPNPRADETIYCVRVALGAQPFDLGCVVIAGIVGPGDRAVAFNLLAWLRGAAQSIAERECSRSRVALRLMRPRP